MKDNKLHLGYSPLTEKIYLGKQKGKEWIGEKRDVTSEFIQTMLQKFEPEKENTITAGGVPKFKIVVTNSDNDIIKNYKNKVSKVSEMSIIGIMDNMCVESIGNPDLFEAWKKIKADIVKNRNIE
jgi:hypothetical protein